MDYYIIAPSINITSSELYKVKSKISSGSMVLVTKNAKLEDVKYLINDIKFKDLKIVKVSKLISEE